ncbi:helix-turn-helix domain-containing protein [Larkinella terrae]|uniref:Helix-turn-helix domain-containing protein n=1 Tax=Larkinella terrae TaxID=2025311 RepID=A0A7K0EKB9_9BACT|nr:AraC family transcriptional regulator [Larkinella terrae]MRS62172.1 helix-turn-helix domain-containing protein [Larkinella terrae]
MSDIKLYDTRAFTATFMPSDELNAILKGDIGKFFAVRVEDMYRHVHRAVPASRSTIHSCLFITEGEASIKIGSELFTIHQHEMLIVPAGQVFSFEENEVNKGYLCGFHTDFLLEKFGNSVVKDFDFLRVWGNPMIKPDPDSARFIEQVMHRLLFDYSRSGLRNPELLQAYLLALLCEINRVYRPVSVGNPTSSVAITNRFRELLFSMIRTKHLVSDYASLLNITPNHLNKTVKAMTGKSPTKWIDETILLEAKVLLCQTSLSVSEIAFEVGFGDSSYFTRLFKKYEGRTPTEFRRMIEKS